jgi:hypothetical protein
VFSDFLEGGLEVRNLLLLWVSGHGVCMREALWRLVVDFKYGS